MVLFNSVVEVFGSDGCDLGLTTEAFEDFVYLFDASTIGPTLVDHDPQRNPANGQRPREELSRSGSVPLIR